MVRTWLMVGFTAFYETFRCNSPHMVLPMNRYNPFNQGFVWIVEAMRFRVIILIPRSSESEEESSVSRLPAGKLVSIVTPKCMLPRLQEILREKISSIYIREDRGLGKAIHCRIAPLVVFLSTCITLLRRLVILK